MVQTLLADYRAHVG